MQMEYVKKKICVEYKSAVNIHGQLPPHLAYSSLMIFSTRLIMLPTVVSDGWAAVILLPSLRMISIRSPETDEILMFGNAKDEDAKKLNTELFMFMNCLYCVLMASPTVSKCIFYSIRKYSIYYIYIYFTKQFN